MFFTSYGIGSVLFYTIGTTNVCVGFYIYNNLLEAWAIEFVQLSAIDDASSIY